MKKLIAADAVPEGGCKEIGGVNLFVVRKEGQLYLYRNMCPHLGVPLNWDEDQFLDPDGALIQCCNHGALFRMEDGLCLEGPCVGASLSAIPFTIVDGMVAVESS